MAGRTAVLLALAVVVVVWCGGETARTEEGLEERQAWAASALLSFSKAAVQYMKMLQQSLGGQEKMHPAPLRAAMGDEVDNHGMLHPNSHERRPWSPLWEASERAAAREHADFHRSAAPQAATEDWLSCWPWPAVYAAPVLLCDGGEVDAPTYLVKSRLGDDCSITGSVACVCPTLSGKLLSRTGCGVIARECVIRPVSPNFDCPRPPPRSVSLDGQPCVSAARRSTVQFQFQLNCTRYAFQVSPADLQRLYFRANSSSECLPLEKFRAEADALLEEILQLPTSATFILRLWNFHVLSDVSHQYTMKLSNAHISAASLVNVSIDFSEVSDDFVPYGQAYLEASLSGAQFTPQDPQLMVTFPDAAVPSESGTGAASVSFVVITVIAAVLVTVSGCLLGRWALRSVARRKRRMLVKTE